MKLIDYKKFKYILSLYNLTISQVQNDIGVGNAYLHTAFKNDTLPLRVLLKISNKYGIHPMQFFEPIEKEEVQHD